MELHGKTTPHTGHPGEQPSAGSPTPRRLMIGGFLGAGKTTAVSKLAAWLGDRGTRVGLIVNDQGLHLVDREVLADRGFPVEEIPGGCFCCRFDALIAEADPGILREAVREAFAARAMTRRGSRSNGNTSRRSNQADHNPLTGSPQNDSLYPTGH